MVGTEVSRPLHRISHAASMYGVHPFEDVLYGMFPLGSFSYLRLSGHYAEYYLGEWIQ
jgi:hypothetical protein